MPSFISGNVLNLVKGLSIQNWGKVDPDFVSRVFLIRDHAENVNFVRVNYLSCTFLCIDSDYEAISCTMVIEASQLDEIYVTVVWPSGSRLVKGGHESHFTGHLIQKYS